MIVKLILKIIINENIKNNIYTVYNNDVAAGKKKKYFIYVLIFT